MKPGRTAERLPGSHMGTVTGRLNTAGPNMQNIPVRTPEGKIIRDAFTKG